MAPTRGFGLPTDNPSTFCSQGFLRLLIAPMGRAAAARRVLSTGAATVSYETDFGALGWADKLGDEERTVILARIALAG